MRLSGLFRAFSLLVLVGALAACVSGKAPQTTYTARDGAVTAIDSDRESCIKACNADYERCGDRGEGFRSSASQMTDANAIYGTSAACRDELKSCLPRCKGR